MLQLYKFLFGKCGARASARKTIAKEAKEDELRVLFFFPLFNHETICLFEITTRIVMYRYYNLIRKARLKEWEIRCAQSDHATEINQLRRSSFCF